MKNWVYHDIGIERTTKRINGVNIWSYHWNDSAEQPFEAPHPQYPNQRHLFRCYTVRAKGKVIEFAASEVSNLVWCIYVKKPLM